MSPEPPEIVAGGHKNPKLLSEQGSSSQVPNVSESRRHRSDHAFGAWCSTSRCA